MTVAVTVDVFWPSRRRLEELAERLTVNTTATKSTVVLVVRVPIDAVTLAVPGVVPEVRFTSATPNSFVFSDSGISPKSVAKVTFLPTTATFVD